MKKLISVLLAAALLCIACCSIAEEKTQPKILAIYSSPETQIITNDDQSKALADTVIFLYPASTIPTKQSIWEGSRSMALRNCAQHLSKLPSVWFASTK